MKLHLMQKAESRIVDAEKVAKTRRGWRRTEIPWETTSV